MFTREIQDSVAYLSSPAAAKSLATDPYWPKWHSPWWYTACHCMIGNVYRILAG